MNISGIKKYIRKIFFSESEKSFGLHSNLKRDWKIIMFFFLIINLLALIYGYYFFYKTVSEDIFQTTNETELTGAVDETAVFFDKNKLIEELKKFENKNGCSIMSEEKELKILDPSL
ncbi:MAG: hypothetical protein Athens071416_199 [Parcubacteria group bacterium Athens0714_16]|nr:MAG: hypothetical protein Athens071416_199 [Parcubacteria group bacterium Athens0714_16]